jgi:hypothetical protein
VSEVEGISHIKVALARTCNGHIGAAVEDPAGDEREAHGSQGDDGKTGPKDELAYAHRDLLPDERTSGPGPYTDSTTSHETGARSGRRPAVRPVLGVVPQTQDQQGGRDRRTHP